MHFIIAFLQLIVLQYQKTTMSFMDNTPSPLKRKINDSQINCRNRIQPALLQQRLCIT